MGDENKNRDDKPAFDPSGLRAVALGVWKDLKRGAGAVRDDISGFIKKRKKKARDPYAEETKYPKRPGDGFAWRRLYGSIALALVSAGLVGGAAALGFAFIYMAPRVPADADLWNVNRQAAIIVLDRNGAEIAARGAKYGEHVDPGELPDHLIKAILSTEDRRFFDHFGVDLRGTLRAVMTNAKLGGISEGGSTITQQLAKNLFLSPEQTYERKAREALLALWLEGHYTKDEILSLYLNRIYFGAGAYGVESAAQTYFGKSARDVTLAEAAMLAGLPKAPSTYAPTQNPQGAQRRANAVLDNLLEIGAVEPFEAREARLQPPVIMNQNVDSDLGYFFDYAAAKAKAMAPNVPGDLIVTTTVDQKLQRDAEAAVKAALDVDARIKGADQAALVAYDANGAMRAMVGGRSYKESQFNRAAQSKRQPGSAFKPFVYVAAMEAGFTPNSRFVDQPIDIAGWKPTNYTEGFAGPVRLSEALAKSINTVAVQVTERVGRGKVAEAAQRLGIHSDIQPHRSIALGAVDVTLEELTGAYIPFANEGLAPEPYAIEKIETRDGEILFQHEDRAPGRVMSEDVAKKMNHLLYQVMLSGTGRRAYLGRRQSAGKTGTTNDWRDAWFVGYTPQLVAGVWVGNDAYTPMEKVTGGSIPAAIWKEFMLSAHQGLQIAEMDGAYPAATYASEPVLLNFYDQVARGFSRVRRDGDERRGRRIRR
ncbi:transglycosylase domain-containing protein [Hyphococcus sp.]|uniref:transglycosylase domain-containing protein n=1 Tax=Hyphococcus sp. TaxID=2038636 RepID=UPI003CCBA8BF